MASSLTSNMIYRLPNILMTRFAPHCVTPFAKVSVLAAGLGLPVVLQPCCYLLQTYVTERFCTRFVLAQQKPMSANLAGQARLWKNEETATIHKQMLLFTNDAMARDIVNVIWQATRVAIDLGLGLWTISSIGTAAPALIAISVGISAFPLVVTALASRAQVGADARLLKAEQDITNHVDAFWDNTVIGPKQCRESWERDYGRCLQRARRARLHKTAIFQLITFGGELPRTFLSLIQSLPYYANSLFEVDYSFVTQANLNAFNSVFMGLNALHGAYYLLSSAQAVGNQIAMQQQQREQWETVPPLCTMIEAQKLTVTQGNETLQVADIIRNPDVLRRSGISTVRAANGSGKTALLSLLRQHFADDALFLPAAHRLAFGLPKGSTGETVMRIFTYIDELTVKPAVILLDEWDANLDPTNTRLAAAMVARWSTQVSVIEVRNKN